MVESEIWPNTLAALSARHIPTALLNARLSTTSARRWRQVLPFARRLFSSFALIWARSQQDAGRLTLLTGHPVAAPGDLKFAAGPLPADPQALAHLQTALAPHPVWTAASLHPGEDAIVTAAHDRLAQRHPGLVTLIVPRHPSRGAAMATAYPMPRRSLNQPPIPGRPYLADTLGELGLFYRLGACALVGGSLIPHGGQNPLEPARLGVPVAMGPHTANFTEACTALRQAGALTDVTGIDDLTAWVDHMLTNPPHGPAASAAAAKWSDLPTQCAQALLALLA
jgi:3-deoxy-D-manno-octulosonic-acid transferase